jgi:thioredoxin-related protein
MRCSLGPLLAVGLLWVAANTHAGGIDLATDLRADAKLSARDGAPIVVFFSSYGCPYCEIVSSLYLEPLTARGNAGGTVRVREVETGSRDSMRDFSGRQTTHADFADAERVSVTPILKFFGANGEEITEPLIGYSNAYFYGEYLEASLRTTRH